jgi:hypothetical protein
MPALVEAFFADFGPLEWSLWVAGGAALLVILLPFAVSACLGGPLVRFSTSNRPADAEPDGTDPEYAEKYHELLALGFRPCGSVTERVCFWTYKLYKATRVRKLISADGRTCASLYRLGKWGVILRVAFASLTEKGCLVQTAYPGAGLTEHEADSHRTEVPVGTVAEVYAHHLGELEAVSAASGQATAATLADVAKADERYSARFLSGTKATDGLWYPAIGWVVPFVVTLLTLAVVSAAPWSQLIGWALVFAGVSYAVLVVKVMPWLLRICEQLPDPETADEDEVETAGKE